MLNIFKQNHPKGLYLLFFVEMWERFSYYGMRALIVLYMIDRLAFSVQKAGDIYGLYTGLVYLTPLIGGYLADRYFGQRKCITAGAISMIIGLSLLASGINYLFFAALFFMITANGLFKSNISSVLGLLYGNNNEKKDSAYTIFYMGINLGAFLSPLVCGTLAVKLGYEYGFAASGIGMLIGLTIYKIFENKWLGEHGVKPTALLQNNLDVQEENTNGNSQLLALIALMLFTIPFWICFEQAGSSLTLFAQHNVNRVFFSHEIPTGYFQSLNPLFIITLAPLMSMLWENMRLKSKEPTSVQKFAISLFLMTIAYIIMTYAGYLSANEKISCLWLVLGYFVMTISELCLSPIGLSLVSKLAPKKFLSLMMGGWFLTSCFGNTIAGSWGGRYETVSPFELFGSFAILSFTAFVLLTLALPKLNKTIEKN